jgi:hypothetical protein
VRERGRVAVAVQPGPQSREDHLASCGRSGPTLCDTLSMSYRVDCSLSLAPKI